MQKTKIVAIALLLLGTIVVSGSGFAEARRLQPRVGFDNRILDLNLHEGPDADEFVGDRMGELRAAEQE